jgi:hypothetical protein
MAVTNSTRIIDPAICLRLLASIKLLLRAEPAPSEVLVMMLCSGT